VAQAQPEGRLRGPHPGRPARSEFYLGMFRRSAGDKNSGFEPVQEGRALKPEALAPFLAERLPILLPPCA